MTEVAAVIVRECIRYVAETDIIGDAMHLSSDLGFDSLNRVELRQAIEESLGIEISDSELDDAETVGDVIRLVEGKMMGSKAP